MLVGAVTVLVALVAVYLAYNANAGLPFVPTYDVKAQIPGGSNLVEANEVRIGGFRAGAVDRILPGIAQPGQRAGGQDRDARSVAVIEMKLDKRFEPIARDSRIQIRPRSALGLKYVDLQPGKSKAKLPAGRHAAAGPVAQAGGAGRLLQHLQRRVPQSTSARCSRATATRWPAAARTSTR